MAVVPRARRRLLQCSVTAGGNVSILDLSTLVISGNSHAPMAYMNSDEIARHILARLDKILQKESKKVKMNTCYAVRPYECNLSGSLCFSYLYT